MIKLGKFNKSPFSAIFLVAFLYFIFGFLGLLLALPPGYATVIWIPSGIALGASLVWGTNIIPGVFIGSLLTNFLMTIWSGGILWSGIPLAVATSIATGASLQTYVGRYLIKKIIGLNNLLNDPTDILLFALISGPVSCLVNATWSNIALVLLFIQPTENFLLNWVTWWVGDSIGVLIFTPIFLILFAEPRAEWKQRILSVFLPLIVSFVMVITIFLINYFAEFNRVKRVFHNQINETLSPVPSNLNNLKQMLRVNEARFYAIDLTLTENVDKETGYSYRSAGPIPMWAHYLQYQKVINISNSSWLLTLIPSSAFIATAVSNLLWSVILSGLFFCVLINIILFILQGQKTKAENMKFKMILEASPDAMIIINAHDSIIFANKETENIFGFPVNEMLGKSFAMLIPKGLEERGKEIIGVKKNNEKFPVEISVSPLEVAEFDVKLIGIRDVTERKKIDKLKNEFISIVSHELRTPLTSILGALSFLTSGVVEDNLSEKSLKLLKIARQNTQRLIKLINDMLDIEKIESGKNQLEFKETMLADFLEEAVSVNQPYAINYDVTIDLVTPVPQVFIRIDFNRMLQVLSNLISNAVKFSPKGSMVLVAAHITNNAVRISVRDRGSGIPEDFKSKIFDKFAQADASSTRVHGGSGLGLSISKAIIEKHGSSIHYESNKSGTTFYFDLPAV